MMVAGCVLRYLNTLGCIVPFYINTGNTAEKNNIE